MNSLAFISGACMAVGTIAGIVGSKVDAKIAQKDLDERDRANREYTDKRIEELKRSGK